MSMTMKKKTSFDPDEPINTNRMSPSQLARRNAPMMKEGEPRDQSAFFGKTLPELIAKEDAEAASVNPGTMTPGDLGNENSTPELVVHSSHYNKGKIEVIDFINDQCDNGLCWNLGTAIKHLSRSPHKGQERMDLEKAIFYTQHKLARVASPQETVSYLEKLIAGIKKKHSLSDQ